MSEEDKIPSPEDRSSETRHSIAELMDPSGKFQEAYSGENNKWGKYQVLISLSLAALYLIYILSR